MEGRKSGKEFLLVRKEEVRVGWADRVLSDCKAIGERKDGDLGPLWAVDDEGTLRRCRNPVFRDQSCLFCCFLPFSTSEQFTAKMVESESNLPHREDNKVS